MSPRQSIASPTDPPTFLRRKVASHSTGPSTSRSQQSVQSPSPPHTITASRRLRVTPSPSVLLLVENACYNEVKYSILEVQMCNTFIYLYLIIVHRGTKRDRVTRNLPTPTQSPHSMSPIADSSRVFEASEEVPDTREHEVVRAITKDFKALFFGEETQWHKLDKDLVDIFYKSFQARYQYEDNVDPETARHIWEERAKLKFSGLWVLVRKNCKKKTGSTNPAHWRLVCPEFVNEEDWDGFLSSWMTEKWKKRSAAGVASRKKVPGDEEGSYVRHTGGCVSFEIHRWSLTVSVYWFPVRCLV
ncbi:hypothetical protein Tco_1138613 [Tanacetum coccineum]